MSIQALSAFTHTFRCFVWKFGAADAICMAFFAWLFLFFTWPKPGVFEQSNVAVCQYANRLRDDCTCCITGGLNSSIVP